MLIKIEDHEVEWDLPEKGVLLKAIIEEMETFLLTVGKVPIALTIDGHSLTQEEFEASQDKPVKGDEVIEIGVIGLTEFVLQNLKGAEEANKLLTEKISVFANELYSTTKTIEPQEVTEDIRHFFFFWVRICNLLPQVFDSIEIEGKAVKEVILNMQEIFKEIVSAMEDEDIVLAADLIQYEILPVIESVGENIPLYVEKINEINEEFQGEAKKEKKKGEETVRQKYQKR